LNNKFLSANINFNLIINAMQFQRIKLFATKKLKNEYIWHKEEENSSLISNWIK